MLKGRNGTVGILLSPCLYRHEFDAIAIGTDCERRPIPSAGEGFNNWPQAEPQHSGTEEIIL